METVGIIIGILVSILFTIAGLYVFLTVLATDSLGELRYRLRCAEEIREALLYENKEVEQLEEEIQWLKAKINSHWGRKIARKSVFDYMKTPK